MKGASRKVDACQEKYGEESKRNAKERVGGKKRGLKRRVRNRQRVRKRKVEVCKRDTRLKKRYAHTPKGEAERLRTKEAHTNKNVNKRSGHKLAADDNCKY